MTYNIHRWAGRDQRIDLDRIAEVISAAGADVVGLNEVIHPVTSQFGERKPLVELTRLLGMHYAFGPSGWADRGPAWSGPVGNALLSKYPLASVKNILLPRFPTSKQRSMLGAMLSAGPALGLTTHVTHLDHAFEGTRLLQIRGVLDDIRQRGPHCLMGDFNTPGFTGQHSRRWLPPVLRSLRRAGYQDAFDAVGAGGGHTFPSQTPMFRLDFLFFPRRWAPGLRLAHTVDMDIIAHASDHRPVIADWVWPDEVSASRPSRRRPLLS